MKKKSTINADFFHLKRLSSVAHDAKQVQKQIDEIHVKRQRAGNSLLCRIIDMPEGHVL